MFKFAVKVREVLSNSQSLNKYLEEQVRELIIGIIELMLELEISEQLCRKKYQRLKTDQSKRYYRNGYRYRYFLTIYSMMLRIKVPRSRGKKYVPVLFRDKNLIEPALEKMLLQLWSDGNSYRDIRNFVRKIYGSEISLGFLSRMVRKIDEYVKAYHNREIKQEYDCIYIDGLEISIKDQTPRNPNDYYPGRKIGKNMVVLSVLGQRRENGKIIREMIDYLIAGSENQDSYTELLRGLQNRGLTGKKIRLIVHDGEPSIRLGIRNVYEKDKIPEQECMFHKLLNILTYVKDKRDTIELRKEIWKVYSSEKKEEYEKRRAELIKKWGKIEPEAIEVFSYSDDKLKTKYEFETEIYSSIHTNNPIERYFRELRRRIKAMGIFEKKESADRLLFLMIESINQRRGSLPSFPDLKFTH